MTKAEILEAVTEAAKGAQMRAANRGWSLKEQTRCAKEAAQAQLALHETTWEALTE